MVGKWIFGMWVGLRLWRCGMEAGQLDEVDGPAVLAKARTAVLATPHLTAPFVVVPE
jgi:hypothetical protein